MVHPETKPAETQATQHHAALADELRAMIASWDCIDTSRKAEIVAGLESLIEEGGIPLEDLEAWVSSWDTSGELPEPQGRR
jgi:hypothetical protein